MSTTTKVEYRIKPVTRFVVTRYFENEDGAAGVEERGEYDNEAVAFEVATALCKAEHQILGYLPADDRIQYPSRLECPSKAA